MSDEFDPLKPPPHATRHCRHYSYVPATGPRCSMAVDLTGRGDALKCMPDVMRESTRNSLLLNHGRVVDQDDCDFREEYTDAEREAWEAWRTKKLAISIVITASLPDGEPGSTGALQCPSCIFGTIRWTRASNGHIWASCTTPHCFQVIQ